ncbi:MAG TPA: prepilin-type N-terminal cleavage/methylation domain-containing protein [Bryobacteraceae bacterium]|nr:prepilin-type N-terminal cleavage/methylation domain-containing protein [Bryobacteraceae bacterium]
MWNSRERHTQKRRGFSLIELLIVIAIILIIVTVALPKLNNATRYAHETAALKAIQTIHTMQVQYNSQYGHYATSLAELGPPATGNANASAADLIDSSLAAGEKSGYKFTMTGNQSGYQISAVPVAYGNTGSRTFYSDQSMVIRENDGPEPATASSKEIK